MSDQAVRPPVSGEIVTGRHRQSSASAVEILDAEFVTLGRRAPDASADASPRRAPQHHGLASLAARSPGRVRGARAGAAFWLTGFGAAAAAFWISGGHALVASAKFPSSAEPLRVTRFQSRIEPGAAGPILFVEGEVINEGMRSTDLPPLSIDVSTGDGVTRFLLGERGGVIAASGRLHFSGRLAAPPGRIDTVTVTLGVRTMRNHKGA